MKTHITYSLLAAAAACGMACGAETAYTSPVGYTTQTLAANSFNLVGFNVLTPSLVTGKLTGVSGSTLTDSNVNFTNLLPAGKLCVVDITTGAAAASVQEFVTWSGSSITLPAALAGVAVGDSYSVRVCPTVQEIFTTTNVTMAANATGSDIIWVPNGAGGYTKYWRNSNDSGNLHTTITGTTDAGAVTADVPLVYLDGILVQKKSIAGSLVLSGEVKKTGSNNLVTQGFNVVGIVPPVGSTLFTAGFNPASAASATGSDLIWVPNGVGGYTKYWKKSNDSGNWHTTVTGSTDAGVVSTDVSLPAAVYYQRKSGSLILTQAVPSSFSNL